MELERLVAKTKTRDDGRVDYPPQQRQVQKPQQQQQRIFQRQDSYENKRREIPAERSRPRDDGLDDDFVPMKRRNVNQPKPMQQQQQVTKAKILQQQLRAMQQLPTQQMQQVLIPITEPIQQLQQQTLLVSRHQESG